MMITTEAWEIIERLAGVDEPAPVAPRVLRTPEHRLMVDVLARAIKDASDKKPAIRAGARDWLRARPGFTARDCCDVLGIDYESVLRRLEEQWKSST